MRGVKNIMFGTSKTGKGGVASVIYKLNSVGFFSRWNIQHIVTHVSTADRLGCIRVAIYIYSLLLTAWLLMIKRIGVAHIHMSSRGSYKRKALLIKILSLFKVKIILHLHGAEFKDFYLNENTKKQQLNIRFIFNQVERVVVLSHQWHEWVSTLVEDSTKVRIIYNSVDSLALDKSKQIPGTILFLGRLGARKGVSDLLIAFSEVIKACPEAKLILGGDGDIACFKEQAKQLGLQESVSFLGWISGQAKLEHLAQADVFCLPSYNEGFPMGILEAMSASKAIVASKAGGIPDALIHQQSGFLFNAGDTKELAHLLISVIKNRKSNNQIANNAKQRFEDLFSEQAIIPQLDALYMELLNE